jgi:hypothetical protein
MRWRNVPGRLHTEQMLFGLPREENEKERKRTSPRGENPKMRARVRIYLKLFMQMNE